MNLLKCAFGISIEKLLEFTVHGKAFDLDLANAKASTDMEPPETVKQLKVS